MKAMHFLGIIAFIFYIIFFYYVFFAEVPQGQEAANQLHFDTITSIAIAIVATIFWLLMGIMARRSNKYINKR
jgi:DMSO/TMAO reductase YedYZ heme-binding membrane subunit